MSINKLVPISNAFVRVSEMTDEDTLRRKPLLIKWAKDADIKIDGSYSLEYQYYVLNIENNKAEIPFSAVGLKRMIFGDHLAECPNVFNRIELTLQSSTLTNGETLIWRSLDKGSFTCYEIPWIVQDNYIVFENTTNQTEITVKVLAYKKDMNGIPLVNENHLEAIAIYLQAQLAKREQWGKFKRGKMTNIDRAYVNDLMREFVLQARLSRVMDDEQKQEQENAQIGIMLANPISGSSELNLVHGNY